MVKINCSSAQCEFCQLHLSSFIPQGSLRPVHNLDMSFLNIVLFQYIPWYFISVAISFSGIFFPGFSRILTFAFQLFIYKPIADVLKGLLNYVPFVSTCLRALNYYVPTCLRVLIFYVPIYIFMPTCLCALNYFVPMCTHFSRTYLPKTTHKIY